MMPSPLPLDALQLKWFGRIAFERHTELLHMYNTYMRQARHPVVVEPDHDASEAYHHLRVCVCVYNCTTIVPTPLLWPVFVMSCAAITGERGPACGRS